MPENQNQQPKQTSFDEFFRDVVVPIAEESKAWKTADMERALNDAIGLYEAKQMTRETFVAVVKKLSNVSALRQDFEKAGIIPTTKGDNWLAKLTK